MHQFTYNFFLLHIDVIFEDKSFEIVNLQTDNTFILIDKYFAEIKKIELHRIKLLIKFRKQLIIIISIKFNDDYLKQQNNSIFFNQDQLCQFFCSIKIQSINFINTKSMIKKLTISKNQYIV